MFDRRKLANCAWFFGFMTLGIASITGMVRAYCGLEPRKQTRRASEVIADACAAKKEPDQ